MKFKTVFSREVCPFCSSSGNRYHKQLQLRILPNGKHEFIEVSVDDLFSEIQTYSNSTDIHWILDHFSNNPVGLSERLSKCQGQYIDLTEMPNTFHDLVQKVEDSKRFFNSLPKELREKFDNSLDVFMSTLGSDSSNKIFDDFFGKSDIVKDIPEKKDISQKESVKDE